MIIAVAAVAALVTVLLTDSDDASTPETTTTTTPATTIPDESTVTQEQLAIIADVNRELDEVLADLDAATAGPRQDAAAAITQINAASRNNDCDAAAATGDQFRVARARINAAIERAQQRSEEVLAPLSEFELPIKREVTSARFDARQRVDEAAEAIMDGASDDNAQSFLLNCALIADS